MFVIFEGIDGSGKSTLLKHILDNYQRAYGSKLVTMSGTDRTNQAILDHLSGKNTLPDMELAKMFIAYMANMTPAIKQSMETGHYVIGDRWFMSTIAYNSISGTDQDHIEKLIKETELLIPDLTIYIDCDPGIALERINKRNGLTEAYDNLEELTRVRNNYLSLVNQRGFTYLTKRLLVIPYGLQIGEGVETIKNYIYNEFGI